LEYIYVNVCRNMCVVFAINSNKLLFSNYVDSFDKCRYCYSCIKTSRRILYRIYSVLSQKCISNTVMQFVEFELCIRQEDSQQRYNASRLWFLRLLSLFCFLFRNWHALVRPERSVYLSVALLPFETLILFVNQSSQNSVSFDSRKESKSFIYKNYKIGRKGQTNNKVHIIP